MIELHHTTSCLTSLNFVPFACCASASSILKPMICNEDWKYVRQGISFEWSWCFPYAHAHIHLKCSYLLLCIRYTATLLMQNHHELSPLCSMSVNLTEEEWLERLNLLAYAVDGTEEERVSTAILALLVYY